MRMSSSRQTPDTHAGQMRQSTTMTNLDIPLALTQPHTPRVENFALLAGLEAAVRGVLISAMPLHVYATLGNAEKTSIAYFLAGVTALSWGLMLPWITRFIPRRWTYSMGCGFYLVGMGLALIGGPLAICAAIIFNSLATATTFVCFNAYLLDYINRAELGRSQSLQMFYSAASWAVGPLLGVWLRSLWAPAPFLLAGAFAIALLVTFWVLRLGNGRQITRARGPALNPLAYLGRFFHQPRLIAGWSFAVLRSCGWWVYVVYLPIFCVESGLGDKTGGIALSCTNALLFSAPLLLRFMRRNSVRFAVRFGFGACGALFLLAGLLSPIPWATVGFVVAASTFLVLLDVVGGLPFLMAVKPSERTEMSAVYSSFRDVSGILTPGAAWLVLLVAPLPGIFLAAGFGLFIAYLTAGRLPHRLGVPRPSRGGA